ncbi:hypothetical protein LENED_006870 [Lentinula edodes]|uniref:Uncharacterized protein n=1 Tax=Lentinula edodes TaxID=5353 RepID=A0A1Q3ECZ8_LENED|nr:hypothetical protein LENED_006870 [Lentinula edodes]
MGNDTVVIAASGSMESKIRPDTLSLPVFVFAHRSLHSSLISKTASYIHLTYSVSVHHHFFHSVAMLLLPPSLLRSLSVSVLIFPIILGVLAMPLASHATTPQLQLHDNPIRTRPLNLRRYNMGDKLLRNVPTKRPGCVLLLDYYERWVLVWGTKHLFRAQAHNGAWNIQTTDIDEQMSSGTLLGRTNSLHFKKS